MTDRVAERIFDTLVDGIVAGRMIAGEPLMEKALAEQFGVSRTPVREALHRLEQSNLAERGARRAYFVSHLQARDLAELFEAVGEVESALAALATHRLTEIERQQLLVILEEGWTCGDDPEAYGRINARFHEVIKTGARSPVLARSFDDLNRRALAWRAANFHEDGNRLSTSRAEHQALSDAILARTPKRHAA